MNPHTIPKPGTAEKTQTNYFERFADLGYTRLVPVTPPDAPISEGSSLFKRIGTSQDGRGKTPGVRGRNGNWYGFDWVPHEADAQDYRRWHDMGAGVGIKTGQGLVGIDADTLNERFAKIIKDTITEFIGETPIRIGNAPKALYPVRVLGPVPYQRIDFGPNVAPAGKAPSYERVEILSDGRFFVAQGLHPKTKKPYAWVRAPIAFDKLPTLNPQQVTQLLETLRGLLPEASKVLKKDGSASEISQAALKGDTELIRKAVAAIPNTSALFPSRESYCDMGYAIKAAVENEHDAFEIFADWCDRWADGSNDPDVVASDWSRMQPPFKRGASWLYELAERHGSPGAFSVGEVWFEDLENPDNPFTEPLSTPNIAAPAIRATLYEFPAPGQIQPRQWLYGQHYIRKFVSATVAPSGVGKSSLEIVEALAMASGKPLLGIEPKGQFRVWLWNGEDPLDELQRRIAAAMMHYGLTADDIGGRLFVDSGRDTEILLASSTRDGAKISTPVVEAVLQQIMQNSIDVLQIDPFVSSHRVSENDNGAIDAVTKQWAKIADAGNCSVELVHHVRKLNGQEITVEDSRGASALLATSRSARAISRMTRVEGLKLGLEASHKRLFRFGDGKNNLALPADEKTRWFELVNVQLGNGPGDAADAFLNGDHVGVVTSRTVSADVPEPDCDEQAAALAFIRAGEWRRDVRAGETWVGVAIAQAMHMDIADAEDKGRISAIVSAWIKSRVLIETVGKDAGRKQRIYVRVAEGQDVRTNSIFD